ncbi:MAG: hypothetical protein FJX56_03090 [Alphaproteobacteria bacterium]|nr:hypothetical protein [Alphaproteobacteria bacterium]
MLRLWRGAALGAGLSLVCGFLPAIADPVPIKADRVVVLKKERTLLLLRDGAVLGRFRIALGSAPIGHKLQSGDGRTPEGRYLLDQRNPESEFHRSIRISYPNEEDEVRARARRVSPGGLIMIHGLPKGYDSMGSGHAAEDWTDGCVAVSNPEMDEIWMRVDLGTPIDLLPDATHLAVPVSADL